jgi:hypothetical protein
MTLNEQFSICQNYIKQLQSEHATREASLKAEIAELESSNNALIIASVKAEHPNMFTFAADLPSSEAAEQPTSVAATREASLLSRIAELESTVTAYRIAAEQPTSVAAEQHECSLCGSKFSGFIKTTELYIEHLEQHVIQFTAVLNTGNPYLFKQPTSFTASQPSSRAAQSMKAEIADIESQILKIRALGDSLKAELADLPELESN